MSDLYLYPATAKTGYFGLRGSECSSPGTSERNACYFSVLPHLSTLDSIAYTCTTIRSLYQPQAIYNIQYAATIAANQIIYAIAYNSTVPPVPSSFIECILAPRLCISISSNSTAINIKYSTSASGLDRDRTLSFVGDCQLPVAKSSI